MPEMLYIVVDIKHTLGFNVCHIMYVLKLLVPVWKVPLRHRDGGTWMLEAGRHWRNFVPLHCQRSSSVVHRGTDQLFPLPHAQSL